VREDLAKLGIERAEEQREPEDHIAILLRVNGASRDPPLRYDAGADRLFFERQLKPWAARFFADCETSRRPGSTRRSAQVGRLFMEVEAEAFAWTPKAASASRTVSERIRLLTFPGRCRAAATGKGSLRALLLREDPMTDKSNKAMDRRNFLRGVGGASTVAVAAVASPLVATEAQAYNPGSDETKARYRKPST
jgi:hypothetical protein